MPPKTPHLPSPIALPPLSDLPPAVSAKSNAETVTCGDPIDVTTGRMIYVETDVTMPGLTLQRSHRSDYRWGRSFGPTWASTLDQRIISDDRHAWFLADDGSILKFRVPAEGGECLPVLGRRVVLRRLVGGGWTVTDRDTVLLFDLPTAGGESLVCDVLSGDKYWHVHRSEDGTPALLESATGDMVEISCVDGLVTGTRFLPADDADDVVDLPSYRYDDRRNLVEVTNSSGAAVRLAYDDVGRIMRWDDRNEQWYTYHYDEAGRCVLADGRDGYLRYAFEYGDGFTVATDSRGGVHRFEFNDRLQITATADPLGATTHAEWDAANRMVSQTDPLGRITRCTYDDDGRPLSLTRPDGSSTTVEYDEAGQPVSWIGFDGTRHATGAGPDRVPEHSFDLDGLGRPRSVRFPDGTVTEFGWTVEGDLAWRIDPDGSMQEWNYDGEGNLVESIDGSGRAVIIEYGPFDLPTARVDEAGNRTEFAYDTELRLAEVTNPAGQVWRYTYDAAGRLAEETDFDGRVQHYTHDEAGQLVAHTNAAGETTYYTWDVLGRVTERRIGGLVTRLEYDAEGRVVGVVSPDATVHFERDEQGRVVAETINGHTVRTSYHGDSALVQARTMPSGRATRWTFDAQGRPESLATGRHLVHFGHDTAGREVSRTVDGAVALRQWFDDAGRLAFQQIAGTAERGFSYDESGRVAAIADSLDGERSFAADELGRIHTVALGDTPSERYEYDETGTLVGTGGGRWRFDGTTLLSSDDALFEYDDNGRLVYRVDQAGAWRFSWDAEDRMVEALTPDGDRWRYRYDGFGRRIAKQRLAEDDTVLEEVTFAWSGDLMLEQVHRDATGATTTTSWEYRPDGSAPVAQADDEALRTVVTDLVGTPTHLVEADGALRWWSRGDLWGRTPDGITGATPLRFPGQYFDAETGLHYNRFRYYDPATARYLSADPLGLSGGPNPTAYVSDPLTFADPLGLTSCKPAQPALSPNVTGPSNPALPSTATQPGQPTSPPTRVGPPPADGLYGMPRRQTYVIHHRDGTVTRETRYDPTPSPPGDSTPAGQQRALAGEWQRDVAQAPRVALISPYSNAHQSLQNIRSDLHQLTGHAPRTGPRRDDIGPLTARQNEPMIGNRRYNSTGRRPGVGNQIGAERDGGRQTARQIRDYLRGHPDGIRRIQSTAGREFASLTFSETARGYDEEVRNLPGALGHLAGLSAADARHQWNTIGNWFPPANRGYSNEDYVPPEDRANYNEVMPPRADGTHSTPSIDSTDDSGEYEEIRPTRQLRPSNNPPPRNHRPQPRRGRRDEYDSDSGDRSRSPRDDIPIIAPRSQSRRPGGSSSSQYRSRSTHRPSGSRRGWFGQPSSSPVVTTPFGTTQASPNPAATTPATSQTQPTFAQQLANLSGNPAAQTQLRDQMRSQLQVNLTANNGKPVSVLAANAHGTTPRTNEDLNTLVHTDYPFMQHINNGLGTNTPNCIYNVQSVDEAQSSGRIFQAPPTTNPLPLSELDNTYPGRSFEELGNTANLLNKVADLPPGVRGIVGLREGPPGTTGHVINVTKDPSGAVTFLDGQSGGLATIPPIGPNGSVSFMQTADPTNSPSDASTSSPVSGDTRSDNQVHSDNGVAGASPAINAAPSAPFTNVAPAAVAKTTEQTPTVGDPIDVTTGRMILTHTDAVMPGLTLERTYRSDYRWGRSFGTAWASTLDQRIIVDGDQVRYLAADGSVLTYPLPAEGDETLPDVGRALPLRRLIGGGWLLTDPATGRSMLFEPAGPTESLLSDIMEGTLSWVITRDSVGTPTELRSSMDSVIGLSSSNGVVTVLWLPNRAGDLVAASRFHYDEALNLVRVLNSSGDPEWFDYTDGRIVRWEDRNGEWYTYTYDENGRCVATDGKGGFLRYRFDYQPGSTVVTDSLGAVRRYEFNDRLQVAAETDPLGGTTRFEWDPAYRLLSQTDQLGRTTTYEYDAEGRRTSVTRPDGSRSTIGYDQAGRATSWIDFDGTARNREFDAEGRLIAETDADGMVVQFELPSDGRDTVVQVGPAVMVENPARLITSVTTGDTESRYEYDHLGRVIYIENEAGITDLDWTLEGELAVRENPDGTLEEYVYDGEGNLIEQIDRDDRRTLFEYGAFDLLTAQIDHDGNRTEYTYDTELRVTSVTNPAGETRRYTYDPNGQMIEETDFAGRTHRYAYDAAGQLIEHTHPSGEVTSYTYDLLGQVIERRTGTAVTRFAYDAAGRVVRAVDADSDIQLKRDALGRVVSETVNGRTVQTSYSEQFGTVAARSRPSGAVTQWSYDDAGRPTVLVAGGHQVQFGYAGGLEVSRTADTGLALEQTFDEWGRLVGQRIDGVTDRQYTYDGNDRVIAVHDEVQGERRVDADAAGNPGDARYTLDASGRPVTRSDAAGDWQFAWDHRDQLVGVLTPGGERWQYRYDAFGRRIGKQRLDGTGAVLEDIQFTWSGDLLVEQHRRDRDGGNMTTAWEYHPALVYPVVQVTDNALHTVVTDGAGDPMDLVGIDGGATMGPDAIPLRSGGRYLDPETGLQYDRNGYFDPATQRFLPEPRTAPVAVG